MLILLHSSVGADALSVGIVGGGPSGASFAGRLREAFGSAAEITVFEAKGHLGGQAQTVVTDGVVQDKGTRYIAKSAGRSVLFDEVTAFLRRHAGQGKDFTPYAIGNSPGLFNGTGAAAGVSEFDGWQDAMLQFGQQVAAYEKGARAYLFSRAEYNAPANFSSLHPSVRAYLDILVNGQLYGPYADVSAHSLYTWFAGFESFGSRAAPLQVEGGFGPAFQNLFASVGATIRLSSRVANVTGAAAGSGQKPTVFLESGEAIEFDAVVVTLPLDTFPTPLKADIGRPLGAFADTYVSSMSFSVAGGAAPPQQRAYATYPGAALATVTYDGTGASGGRQFFVAYMYEPADTALNESMSITRVWPEVSAMTQFIRGRTEPLALADVQVTPGSWERYRYNIRFSVDQLARGVPQDIHRAQGQSGVWYGGGSLSHWNVGDILEQASQTVARMAAAHGSEWTHQTVAKVASRSRVAVALSGAWGDAPGAAPRAFFGWYELKGNPLVTAVLVERLPGKEEAALMATLPAHFLGNGGVVGVGVIRLRNMELTAFGTAHYAAMQPQEGYYLALHENGVVRFHANVLSLASAKTLLAGDSKGAADAALNVAHQMRYGSFCFGVFRLSSAGGASIQRYNRWAEAVDPYYVMDRDGPHTACAADEECPAGFGCSLASHKARMLLFAKIPAAARGQCVPN